MKKLILSMDDDLHWIKNNSGQTGSYDDKYKNILPDSFISSEEFTELMQKVDSAVATVKEINKVIDDNKISGKFHKAHYYVQWKK